MITRKDTLNDTRIAEDYIQGKKWNRKEQKLEDVKVTLLGFVKLILKQQCVMTKLLLGIRSNTNQGDVDGGYIGDDKKDKE